MEDIVFAVGAQLASYNWQNYNNKEKNIWNILKDSENMNLLLKDEPQEFVNCNTSISIDRKDIKLFKEFDKRLLMYYSESIQGEDYIFKDILENYSFIEGTNHLKIYNETIVEVEKKDINLKTKLRMQMSSTGISEESTTFKAFAMKKGEDIIISFNYELEGSDSKNYAYWELSDGILCAIYFYNKIANQYKNYNIYLTGEKLGGVLAEYITIYESKRIKNTTVWNSFLIDKTLGAKISYKKFLSERKAEIRKINDLRKAEFWIEEFKLNDINDKKQNPYREYEEIKFFQRYLNCDFKLKNIKNFYLFEEELKNFLGEIIFLIKKDESVENNAISFLKNHTFNINNFLPFFDNSGYIKNKIVRKNYICNFVKTIFLDEKNKFNKSFKVEYAYEEIVINSEDILMKMSSNEDENFLCEAENFKEKIILHNSLLNEYNANKSNNNFYIEHNSDDSRRFVLGKDVNYVSLGGIIGNLKLVLSSIDVSNAKKAMIYQLQNGDYVIKDNGDLREGSIVLDGMQLGISAVFEKIDDNYWKEYFGFLDINYYYDKNGKDLIIEWEFID